MAQQALPVATTARTVTIRVRTMVIVAGGLAGIGLVWWALSWASGMQPLAVGAVTYSPLGVTLVPNTRNTYDTGPAVYRWQRGGRIVIALYLHNAASVPVTITGADHPGSYWEGWFRGPSIGIPGAHNDAIVRPFHPVRIPADGMRGVTFVFAANPKACGNNGRGTVLSQDVINVRFSTLGVFDDTQTIALGDEAVYMTGPADNSC